jgi:hypothetical protein
MRKHGTDDNINREGELQQSAEALHEKEKGKLAAKRETGRSEESMPTGPDADPEIARAMGGRKKGSGGKKR